MTYRFLLRPLKSMNLPFVSMKRFMNEWDKTYLFDNDYHPRPALRWKGGTPTIGDEIEGELG